MGFQNLQKLSKNLHPVPRYSSPKLVHVSCQSQFWRYNSVYGSRPLLIMIDLNLGSPWALSLKKSSFRLVFSFVMEPQRDPQKTSTCVRFFDYSIHTVRVRNLKFRLKKVLKELFKMCHQAKKSISLPQRYGQTFLFLSHPVIAYRQ